MNRKERRAAQKRGGPALSPMAQTLMQAFQAHQAGHRTEAERLYRDVLAAEPRNAAALHLLGALMHQSGRVEEAVSLMSQAIAIAPRDPDYRYNLGCALIAAGRHEEAILQLEQAVTLKPDYAAAHFELANALASAGRPAQAEKSLRRVIQLRPGNALAVNNLGLVTMAQGRRDEALALWRRALELQPDLALAPFNIALAEMAQGRVVEAEASLRQTLAARPDYAEAKQQLAACLLAQGKADEALPFANEALTQRESNAARATFAACLLSAHDFQPDAGLRERLRRALQEAWLQPFELAPLAASVIRAHPVLGPAIARVGEQWPKASLAQQHPVLSEIEIAAAGEPLVRAYLETTPNCDIGIELFLIALRAHLLDRAASGQSASALLLDVCAALARQGFLNEYVFGETANEATRVAQLAAAAQGTIHGDGTLPPFQLAALAMYRPLHSLDGGEQLLTRDWPAPVAALLAQQIAEPAKEAALRGAVPRLTAIDDETQDEPAAHPRWTNAITTLTPLALADALRRGLPAQDCPELAALPSPEILIAGCGTGLPAVTAALGYLDARIFATDVSAANLAYAKRKADEFGLSNIEFAQADILKLPALGRRFDAIEARLPAADPLAGWRSLLTLLRPGGLMKVSAYSEIGRRDIVAARDFAASGNYQSDLEGIRLCRQAILRLPEDARARNALLAADFYSSGAFRDLVLRRHEHRLSLPDIRSFLDANGLEFIGLEVADPVRRAFAERFPDPAARKDLAAWHEFETGNPDAFAAYHLWVRKAAA